jgi:hypothetical protein
MIYNLLRKESICFMPHLFCLLVKSESMMLLSVLFNNRSHSCPLYLLCIDQTLYKGVI